MKLEEALVRYVRQLEADGRSQNTIQQYRRQIGMLAAWLRGRGGSGDVEGIGHETLAEFLSSSDVRVLPDGRSKKASSVNAVRSALRTFFRYVHDAGYTRSNPARLIRLALCGTPPPRTISEDEEIRIGKALRDLDATGRDATLIELMLASGARLQSALALEISDLDLDRGEMHLRRMKGDVPVTMPLGRAVCDRLRGYVNGRSVGPVFPGREGRALCARQAQRRLELACERAGIARRVRPHDLRHSFAERLYRRTHDLLLVQRALGHRSITSTTVYARCDEGRLREVLAS
jgi:integrase/recombinase XerC